MYLLRFSMSNILFWNYWGARKKGTCNYLRDLILQHKLGLVGLLDTKVVDILHAKVDRLAGRGWNFFHQPAAGKAGVFWCSGRLLKLGLRCWMRGRNGWWDGLSSQASPACLSLLSTVIRICTFVRQFGLL
ncbi:hypothetical protein KSP40_PGU007747 [Platanthera guangdongensis]|uniref:Uncharacterized protein n=1 Tax=Platanthera guangdongensis TaxID=2320717 RepID=A0ABR2M0F3_9ASPA